MIEIEILLNNEYNSMWGAVVEQIDKSYIKKLYCYGKRWESTKEDTVLDYWSRPEINLIWCSEEHVIRSNEGIELIDCDNYCDISEMKWNQESRKAHMPVKKSNYVGELEERNNKLQKYYTELVKADEEFDSSYEWKKK